MQETQAALEREARQRPRRGDDGQGVRRHPGEGAGHHLDRVPSQQQRRGRRRQRHLRFEPRERLRLIRPQAGAQPPGVIRVGHVDRIEVDADPASGPVLWSRDPGTERPMASDTKVMTALLVLEAGDLGREIRVPQAAIATPEVRR